MADITRLSRLLNGVTRGVDVSTNTIVMASLKLGTTELTKAILDKLILINSAADADGTYDSRYYTQSQVDGLVGGKDDASEITFTPTTATDWDGDIDPGNTDGALDQLASRTDASEIAIGTNATNIGTNVTNIGTNLTSIGNVQAEVDKIEAALGAMVDVNGDYVAHAGKNYINGNLDTTEDLIDLDAQIKTNADAISLISGSGMDLKGGLDASLLGSQLDNAQKGWYYVVTVAGTIFGTNPVSLNVGDNLFCNTNVTGTPDDGASFTKIDNTESPDILRNTHLASAEMFVGNGSGIATAVAITGDVTIDNAGVAAIAAGAIVNADINVAAAIVESKLTLDFSTSGLNTAITNHVGNTSNPHSVTKAQILTGNLIVNADVDAAAAIATSKLADATEIAEAVTFFGATDITGAEAETLTSGVNADDLHVHKKLIAPLTAGEAFAANTTYAVRIAITGETIGNVYKSDIDASVSDKFYAIGLITTTVAVAIGETVYVMTNGIMTLGSSSVAFASAEVGQAVHIKAAGAWDAVSQIAYATDEASYRVGIVLAPDKIMLSGPQLLGIN